jgi:hypothetical protein
MMRTFPPHPGGEDSSIHGTTTMACRFEEEENA